MEENVSYTLGDSVLHRLVQILQVAMMTGVDIADPLRQIRLMHSDEDPGVLVMTKEYDEQFKSMITKLQTQADEIIAGSAYGDEGRSTTRPLIVGA